MAQKKELMEEVSHRKEKSTLIFLMITLFFILNGLAYAQ
jgi:hypothetical protein